MLCAQGLPGAVATGGSDQEPSVARIIRGWNIELGGMRPYGSTADHQAVSHGLCRYQHLVLLEPSRSAAKSRGSERRRVITGRPTPFPSADQPDGNTSPWFMAQ